MTRALIRFIAIALLTAAGASAQAGEPRAVIELFTSQGCSSCPPADELFATMANDPDIITLSLPVDYWDRLGWKDTFATPAFTARQKNYAFVRGDGRVYTPQAVINGSQHAVGSNRSAIDSAVTATASALTVPVDVSNADGTVAISVGAAPGGLNTKGTVVAMPTLSARQVAIGRGENAKRKVTYTNIVREILPLGTWQGEPRDFTIPATQLEGYDGVVVMVQTGAVDEPGPIVGAARTSLR